MNPALLAAMRPRVQFVTQPSDTAPGQPPNLRTTSVSPTAVALAWGAPATGGTVTSYDLLRGGIVIQTGITGLSVVDSTVTAGQGYSYTVRAVGPGGVGPESAALVVEVPDAPDPGGYAFGPGENEPSGLLPFFSWDPATHGIDMTAASGSGSGSLPGLGFDWEDHMSIVADAGTPNGAAMRQDWPTGQGVRAGNMGWTLESHTPDPSLFPGWSTQLGPLTEIYARWMVYIPSSWTRNPGNAKFMGFTMQDGTTPNLDAYLQWRSNDHSWRFQCQENGGPDNLEWETISGDMGGWETNIWYDVEMHLVAQSEPGANDGQVHIWRNGAKSGNWSPLGGGRVSDGTDFEALSSSSPGTKYTRINVWPLYNGGSTAPKPKDEYLLWCGLYMSGRR